MRKKYSLAIIFVSVLCTVFSALGGSVAAAPFTPGRIIDDGIFDNAYTMGAVDIDRFLNSFPSSCISPNRGFRAVVPNGYSPSNGFTYGNYDTAGVVIATAAQVYGINPQVLLANLQKEQALVTGGQGCSIHRYASALGYGCPDSGGSYDYSGVSLYMINGTPVTSISGSCVNSITKVGFSQQVIRSAWTFKFSQQRSRGNVNWAVIMGNWDNSDDPQSCYSGRMTEGTYRRCPSGSAVYYSGINPIDGVSVHMVTGGTVALYQHTPHFHGNQVFNDTFTNWFGNPIMPFAFKSPSNPTIYIYVSGYKLIAASMAVLQDYGISPQSIQTISQTAVDAIPSPPGDTGISLGISSLIKTTSDSDNDGGSIYLVSAGKRWQIQSMDQFFAFGFREADISYLPIGYLTSISGGGMLSDFVTTPTGNVFRVGSGQKRIIFDYDTYRALNPADTVTLLSYFLADAIPGGKPLANSSILVKPTGGEQVFLYTNETYYGIPNFNVYNCWGFETTLRAPVFRASVGNQISSISPASNLHCLTTQSGTTYLLNKVNKVAVPAGYNISGAVASDGNTSAVMNRIATHGSNLKQYVKANNDAAIWYIENGVRKVIPTYNNYLLMGAAAQQHDVLDAGSIASIPVSGMKLATGQVVKTNDSSAVYVINGSNRILYSTSDTFLGFGNNWSDIETYPAATLNAAYPATGSDIEPYYFDGANTVYVINEKACYALPTSSLSAYGLNQSTIATNQQDYNLTTVPRFSTSRCHGPVSFVKAPDSPVVYWITGGQKRPFSSWDKLVQTAQTSNPPIMTIDSAALGNVATGSPV